MTAAGISAQQLDLLPLPAALFAPDGALVAANTAFCTVVSAFVGLPAEMDLITIIDAIPESLRTAFRAAVTACPDDAAGRYDVQEREDVAARTVHMRRQPNGEVLGTFSMEPELIRLAERTRAVAQENAELNARLLSRERYVRALFDESPIGLNLCRLDGLWLESNQAFLDIIGYTAEEADGGLTYWQLTPRRYDAEEQVQLKSLSEHGRYGPYEKEFIRKDGSLVPVRLNGFIIEQDGEQYIWSLIEDITDERRVKKAMDTFVSTVSHELRTPLTSIHGSLQLLQNRLLDQDSTVKKLVDVAARNSVRLKSLVDDVLLLQKLDADSVAYQRVRLDLNAVVRDACEANAAFGRIHATHYRPHHSEAPLWVSADEYRLLQVLNNLLSNAAKYSAPNTGVDVRVLHTADGAHIEVSDEGQGVPDDFRTRLFDQFSRADNADDRPVDGTGLGLSICKAIVEDHGGTISYSPRADKPGSTFRVTLPLA